MNFYLINLVKSCNTLHELKRELEKPLGWFRFKSKKKAKELEKQLDTAISDIVYKDIWDIQYLYDLERMFFVFYKDLIILFKNALNNLTFYLDVYRKL